MKKINVAVISANIELLDFFELELLTLGFNVSAVHSLAEVGGEYELLIIDADTVDTVASAYSCPVICVSSTYRKVEGCTDCLSWPVSVCDVAESCYAAFAQAPAVNMCTSDKENRLYIVDRNEGIAVLDGMHVKLSQTEIKVMEALCMAEGNVVAREQIMRLIGADKGNISDVYICRLRKKLEGICGKRLIYTKRCVGYYTVLRITNK